MLLHYNWPGFNISSWLVTQGVPYTEPLDSHIVDNLMSDLSMAQYLLEPSCSWTSAQYSDAAAMWTNCMNLVIYILKLFFLFSSSFQKDYKMEAVKLTFIYQLKIKTSAYSMMFILQKLTFQNLWKLLYLDIF